MADNSSEQPSKYNQSSFTGGMNLLGDDTRLQPDQYRAGFNLTNRYDQLDLILQSQEDKAAPIGLKQELVTFGNYIILFVAGSAYYRYYSDTGWTKIDGFSMSKTAPRYWTVSVPITTTNYLRLAATTTIGTTDFKSANGAINILSVQGASAGNLPGLLVQDNITQPQFIFIDGSTLKPIVRTTQQFSEWSITFTDDNNTVVAPDGDKREYVPIGNVMAWSNGILFIASQDFNKIYRSVSGRPLDFVVDVSNLLVTTPWVQKGGGNADATAYSVGVGGITCIRALSTGGIFVSASNANFTVTLNNTPGAPTQFGEYTFIRTFLFNATCLSDRAIFDALGDTRFIDLTGVRSFNAVMQTQNEGRNTPFTSTIQSVFTSIVQDASFAAGILYDNYELYGVETIFGPALVKFDDINQCWVSFDIGQTDSKRIKMFAKIELSIQRLYAITEDDRLFTLYIGPEPAIGSVRTVGVCSNTLYANQNIRMNCPDTEVQLEKFRVIITNITENTQSSFIPFVNNRMSVNTPLITKETTFQAAPTSYINTNNLPDINTMLQNILFNTRGTEQGWKVHGLFSWDHGSVTQYSMELTNITPMNPLNTQGVTV